MGKKSKKQEDNVAAPEKKTGPEGGILFEEHEHILNEAIRQTGLSHVSKPWSRKAWERATPWLLMQRQKLEGSGSGWAGTDSMRTELYVLKRVAPSGTYTEDGFLYLRVPKKMIDFFRTARKISNAEENNNNTATTEHKEEYNPSSAKKLSSRQSKRREMRANYDLAEPNVWKIKIDGADSDEPGKVPSVMVDVSEPMENIFYLVMCLQPGLARLFAWRENVIQQGTHETDVRDGINPEDPPTARHRAMVAASESYQRVLPPPYWFKRNRDDLEKILGEGFEATLAAAEDAERSTTRNIKDVEEKVWEEVLKIDPVVAAKKAKKLSKKSAAAARRESMAMETTPAIGTAA